jgi:hypothetical protein
MEQQLDVVRNELKHNITYWDEASLLGPQIPWRKSRWSQGRISLPSYTQVEVGDIVEGPESADRRRDQRYYGITRCWTVPKEFYWSWRNCQIPSFENEMIHSQLDSAKKTDRERAAAVYSSM